MTTLNPSPPANTAGLAGRHIVFELGGEVYALPVRQVLEIIRCLSITRVPNMAPHILGVTNLRGRIVPVLDLRRKFHLPEARVDHKTCTIVIDAPSASGTQTTLGLMVDQVHKVVLIKAGDIETPADYGGCIDAASVLAVARIEDRIVSLLDLAHVLREELAVIA